MNHFLKKSDDGCSIVTERETAHLRNMAERLIKRAKTKGATSAELHLSKTVGLSATVRLSEVEKIEFNRDQGLDLLVYFGQRRGTASTTDLSEVSLERTLSAACDIAKVTAMDEYAGLANPEELAYDYPDLDLYHPWEINSEGAIEIATQCESAAISHPLITNSEGATVSTHEHVNLYANSHGFIGYYPTTRHGMSCVVIAGQGEDMQRDYDYHSVRDPKMLLSAAVVAKKAAVRTAQRLKPRRIKTANVPVIFEAPMAKTLWRHLVSAISGSNLYRGSTFLQDSLGSRLFPNFIQIHERPHELKALGSAPFDAEGVRTNSRTLVEEGVLRGYVLDSYSGRKLGLPTTGNAGGVHNLIVEPTSGDLAALLEQMDTGLLVTELMGQGINLTTGDYSRGAFGYWVEGGHIQHPVSEITIAGSLPDLFERIVSVGSDVDSRGNIQSGSIFIESMMIAGE